MAKCGVRLRGALIFINTGTASHMSDMAIRRSMHLLGYCQGNGVLYCSKGHGKL
jgi:hypothetical protein